MRVLASALLMASATAAKAQDIVTTTVDGLSQIQQTGVVGAVCVLAIGGMVILFLRYERLTKEMFAQQERHAAAIQALHVERNKESAEQLRQVTQAMHALSPAVQELTRIINTKEHR